MIDVKAKAVLLDIEGTTTPISFVKDVLFPYSKENILGFLKEHWYEPETQELAEELCASTQYEEYQEAHQTETDHREPFIEKFSEFVIHLINQNVKMGPLKEIQGLVWEKGYKDKSLKGVVFNDVPAAFSRWKKLGIDIAIYSSGSIKSQQMLFANTEGGSLTPFILEYFDTHAGQKNEEQSYIKIAKKLQLDTGDILFLTDIVAEAKAAISAGMQAILVSRPGNYSLTDDEKSTYTIITDFNCLNVTTK